MGSYCNRINHFFFYNVNNVIISILFNIFFPTAISENASNYYLYEQSNVCYHRLAHWEKSRYPATAGIVCHCLPLKKNYRTAVEIHRKNI